MPLHRGAILLTPGPLTTSLRTKLAMLRDLGSWDEDFIAVTASVRKSLLDIVHGQDGHVVVPLQSSGTFSVEAAVATVVPHEGHVLVLDNGAYCKRAAKRHGFILYPGKLTQTETLRVGCIGAIGTVEMEQAVHAVALAMQELGIAHGVPAGV